MTTNREVLLQDPTTTTIPNLGVAKLGMPSKPDEWNVLRYELSSFVCEGEYRSGLDRILGTFLGRLDQGQQPAAWVSGFYGSGKSHFVRVLDSLWRDMEFPDKAHARGLANLPTEIVDQLKELTNAGKRHGGLWSASGTLSSGAGTSVRLAMLNVIFESAGLPSEYPTGKFVLWLKKEGAYDAVAAAVAARNRTLDDVLADMYVSGVLADAILEAIPGFAASKADVHALLSAQYPMKTELTGDEFVATLEDVLKLQSSVSGKLPLTLLVFDEMQQFLVGDLRRVLEVQEIVQDCSARFDSRVLFVATGQAQLAATSDLQRLQDRFTVKVMLQDSDVEKVVREVVLRKDPSKVPLIEAALDRVSGEIGKHLGGSRIAANASDKPDLVPDYPLLPTRRRFWEAALRSIDHAGTKGQLRAQLDIVHAATRAVADRDLGWVIPADALYKNLESHMQTSGVLPRDTATLIRDRNNGTPDGELLSRVCSLIFLVGKLETQGSNTAGVKATVDTLADLLVEDLNAGSAALRQKLPEMLKRLEGQGFVMDVGGGEYRLQTKESAEWLGDFHKFLASISNDGARIADARATELRSAVGKELAGVKPLQGKGLIPRKVEFHFGTDAPPKSTGAIPIWVRDGWNTTDATIQAEARAAGTDSPVIFVFIPRASGNAIPDAIAAHAAANTTITSRPMPMTPEGSEARAAMDSRVTSERGKLDLQIANVLTSARVFQGGGNEIALGSLLASVKSAANDSTLRLYPKFAMADHAGWGKVREKAHEGVPDAMTFVDHKGDADQHPVCQEVRNFVGASGKKGIDVRKQFMAEPYGWSQDAVDGALYALVAQGVVQARLNSQVVLVKSLPQNQIGSADFHVIDEPINMAHRLAMRGLAADVGLGIKPGEEENAIRPILDRLLLAATHAGGPAPVAAPPSTQDIHDLIALTNQTQFTAVAAKRIELAARFTDWTSREKSIAERLPRWERLQRLLKHAAGLAVAVPVEAQANAILNGRTLLDDPDPGAPLTQQLADALRAEVTAAHRKVVDTRAAELATLEASADWLKLEAADRAAILSECALGPVGDLQVGDPASLLAALDTNPLGDWGDKLAAVPGRVAKAREQAAKKLQPTAVRVTLKGATLNDTAQVESYLSGLRADIMTHINAGNPVIL